MTGQAILQWATTGAMRVRNFGAEMLADVAGAKNRNQRLALQASVPRVSGLG